MTEILLNSLMLIFVVMALGYLEGGLRRARTQRFKAIGTS